MPQTFLCTAYAHTILLLMYLKLVPVCLLYWRWQGGRNKMEKNLLRYYGIFSIPLSAFHCHSSNLFLMLFIVRYCLSRALAPAEFKWKISLRGMRRWNQGRDLCSFITREMKPKASGSLRVFVIFILSWWKAFSEITMAIFFTSSSCSLRAIYEGSDAQHNLTLGEDENNS